MRNTTKIALEHICFGPMNRPIFTLDIFSYLDYKLSCVRYACISLHQDIVSGFGLEHQNIDSFASEYVPTSPVGMSLIAR